MNYLKKTVSQETKKKLAQLCYEINQILKGERKEEWFNSNYGLCRSYSSRYCDSVCIYYSWINGGYPFNGEDDKCGWKEKNENRLYKNKKRLSFIRRWAKKHEKNLAISKKTL
jgi:hypothetical protein